MLDYIFFNIQYLLIDNILLNKSKDFNSLENNVWYVLTKLAKGQDNPLYSRIGDPANTNNILSDLLTTAEKNKIITQAQATIKATNW